MQNTKTQKLVTTAMLTAVLCVLAPLSIPIGPVPITLGVFCVYLMGLLLPPTYAAAAVGVYLVIGCIGLPVFSGFGAGPGVLVGPTGGYLSGYFAVAVCTALTAKKPLGICLMGMAAGLFICYAIGSGWFMHLTGRTLGETLALCVVPFVVPDVLKAAAALALCRLTVLRKHRAQ